MPVPARKKTSVPEPRRRGRAERESAQDRREVDPVDLPERGLIGEIRIEAASAFGPTTGLRVHGLNVLAQAAVQEKEKIP